MTRTDAAAIAEAVRAARNYRWLAPDFVARIAAAEAARSTSLADAIKRTKRRLHQIAGAYVSALDPDRALARLRRASATGDAALRDACRHLMAQHASTCERLPVLDRFYREVYGATGRPRNVLDLACGLGPLALPWMDLPAEGCYYACDVDRRLVEIAGGFLALCGVRHTAELRDVVVAPPKAEADVALLLKAIPCLEQQARGAARRLIESLQVRSVVASFPTRSLGGAGKGMVEHYRKMLYASFDPLAWNVTELLFPLETVYVLRRRA